jgi:hypothetical protein
MRETLNQISNEMLESEKASLPMVLSIIGDLETDIWADYATLRPIKMRIDLGDSLKNSMKLLVNPLLELEAGNIDFEVQALALELSVTDFGAVQDFEIPEFIEEGTDVPTSQPGTDAVQS